MCFLRGVSRSILVFNGLVLVVFAVLLLTGILPSGSGVFDKGFLFLSVYTLLLLPTTSLGAVLVLFRKNFPRAVGWGTVVLGLTSLLWIQGLFPGLCVAYTFLDDGRGGYLLGSDGKPVQVVNPPYLSGIEKREKLDMAAMGLVVCGLLLVILDMDRREKKDSHSRGVPGSSPLTEEKTRA